MARIPRPLIEGATYHTISVVRGRRPLLRHPACANILLEAINHPRAGGKAFLLAYAIMPDHLHLLIAPRADFTISDIMHDIKLNSARRINEYMGLSGAFWQQSFFDRVIRGDAHLSVTAQYIEQNPVTAGLARQPTEYPFSSAHPDASTDIDAFWGDEAPQLEPNDLAWHGRSDDPRLRRDHVTRRRRG
jgi:REP element-mobilizing transposase RayT